MNIVVVIQALVGGIAIVSFCLSLYGLWLNYKQAKVAEYARKIYELLDEKFGKKDRGG